MLVYYARPQPPHTSSDARRAWNAARSPSASRRRSDCSMYMPDIRAASPCHDIYIYTQIHMQRFLPPSPYCSTPRSCRPASHRPITGPAAADLAQPGANLATDRLPMCLFYSTIPHHLVRLFVSFECVGSNGIFGRTSYGHKFCARSEF